MSQKPFLIGLGGDSGSGKKTISEAIAKVVGADRLLVVSMDGYHKWDREEMKCKILTHLNPEANHLDLALEHFSEFKKGNAVKKVNYDHASGHFTEPKLTHPREFVLIMGLHPYHLRDMRALFDLKLFLAPDGDVLKKWKIYRDCAKRGYKKEQVLDILRRRKPDSVAYIRAQEQYADLVMHYFEIGDEPDVHKMKLGGSFIFKNTKCDLKLMRKFLSEHDIHAALEGKAVTVYGDISSVQVEKLAEILFDDSRLFGKQVEWQSGLAGVFQLFFALEVDRRLSGWY